MSALCVKFFLSLNALLLVSAAPTANMTDVSYCEIIYILSGDNPEEIFKYDTLTDQQFPALPALKYCLTLSTPEHQNGEKINVISNLMCREIMFLSLSRCRGNMHLIFKDVNITGEPCTYYKKNLENIPDDEFISLGVNEKDEKIDSIVANFMKLPEKTEVGKPSNCELLCANDMDLVCRLSFLLYTIKEDSPVSAAQLQNMKQPRSDEKDESEPNAPKILPAASEKLPDQNKQKNQPGNTDKQSEATNPETSESETTRTQTSQLEIPKQAAPKLKAPDVSQVKNETTAASDSKPSVLDDKTKGLDDKTKVSDDKTKGLDDKTKDLDDRTKGLDDKTKAKGSDETSSGVGLKKTPTDEDETIPNKQKDSTSTNQTVLKDTSENEPQPEKIKPKKNNSIPEKQVDPDTSGNVQGTIMPSTVTSTKTVTTPTIAVVVTKPTETEQIAEKGSDPADTSDKDKTNDNDHGSKPQDVKNKDNSNGGEKFQGDEEPQSPDADAPEQELNKDDESPLGGDPASKGNEDVQNPDPVNDDNGIQQPNGPIESEKSRPTGVFPEQEDSHFFAYFLTVIIIIILAYLVVHNKQKILGLIVEGRGGQRRRSHSYRKLDTEGSKGSQVIF